MNERKKIVSAILILFGMTLAFLHLCGCSSGVYLLDQPVSDPIMMVDDTPNSDIARCEEGGVAGGSGSCPT
jgi:hypothetical protein